MHLRLLVKAIINYDTESFLIHPIIILLYSYTLIIYVWVKSVIFCSVYKIGNLYKALCKENLKQHYQIYSNLKICF
jgi:hypothetical protein